MHLVMIVGGLQKEFIGFWRVYTMTGFITQALFNAKTGYHHWLRAQWHEMYYHDLEDKLLMAKWLEQASQGHEMYCHDLEPQSGRTGVRSTSVLSRTWSKNTVLGSLCKIKFMRILRMCKSKFHIFYLELYTSNKAILAKRSDVSTANQSL